MRTLTKCLVALAVSLVPATVFAQASLTGTVRDASGAVLPGVTVEAASPALIEKTRTAVTDGSGQYRIIDLRPGTYALTFTLTGFNTVKRENIELAGAQVITIPAEMKVGGVEETITVTGETPVVDVQSAKRQVVMSTDVIETIPAARAAGALLNATPGLFVDTNGPALSPTMTFFQAHSAAVNGPSTVGEGRMTLNGMTVAAARSGGVSSYVYDTANAQEMAITVGGGLGESDIGGPVANLVPQVRRQRLPGHVFLQRRRRMVARRQPDRRAPRDRPDADARHHQVVGHQRLVRRPDHEGPPVVLRQLPQPRHADGDGRHQRQRQRRQRGAVGLGRLADQRPAGAGPPDDDRPSDGPAGPEPALVQLRVPASLRGHAAQGRHPGLPQSRR